MGEQVFNSASDGLGWCGEVCSLQPAEGVKLLDPIDDRSRVAARDYVLC